MKWKWINNHHLLLLYNNLFCFLEINSNLKHSACQEQSIYQKFIELSSAFVLPLGVTVEQDFLILNLSVLAKIQLRIQRRLVLKLHREFFRMRTTVRAEIQILILIPRATLSCPMFWVCVALQWVNDPLILLFIL